MESNALQERVLHALRFMQGIQCKRFFRDWALYQGDHFIGVISNGKLYLRTNHRTRREYIKRGMQPLAVADRAMRRFYEVPDAVVYDDHLLAEWTRDAAAVTNFQERLSETLSRF
ncbi:MAG: TfoX/Sxy family protein [Patescibacteria group bacterium]